MEARETDPHRQETMRAIFIDFDGVLHPAGGPVGACLPFEWLCDLKALLSAHPPVRIVVHSSWRLTYPHEEIRDVDADRKLSHFLV